MQQLLVPQIALKPFLNTTSREAFFAHLSAAPTKKSLQFFGTSACILLVRMINQMYEGADRPNITCSTVQHCVKSI